MSTAWLRYGVDLLLLATVVVLAISSVLVWVVLPKGYHPSWLLWIAIHKWSGFALMIGSLVHVAIHFRWLRGMTRNLLHRVVGRR